MSSPEAEAPAPLLADAHPQAPTAWDASACARPDAAADAAHLEPRPPSADGAERWAAQEQDGRAPGARRRRLGPRAAPAAEPHAAEPCTPAAARFAERSCAAEEAREQKKQSDALQSRPLAEHSLKPPESLPREEPVPLAVAPGVSPAHWWATILLEARPLDAQEQPEPLVAKRPATPLPASSPQVRLQAGRRQLEARPPQAFPPEHASPAAPLDAPLRAASQLPSSA